MKYSCCELLLDIFGQIILLEAIIHIFCRLFRARNISNYSFFSEHFGKKYKFGQVSNERQVRLSRNSCVTHIKTNKKDTYFDNRGYDSMHLNE